MNIELIMATARRDSRRVGGMEIRALCDEIDRLNVKLERYQQTYEGWRIVKEGTDGSLLLENNTGERRRIWRGFNAQETIKTVGMQIILQQLIRAIDGKDPYEHVLRNHLEAALFDYMARHDNEEDMSAR